MIIITLPGMAKQIFGAVEGGKKMEKNNSHESAKYWILICGIMSAVIFTAALSVVAFKRAG